MAHGQLSYHVAAARLRQLILDTTLSDLGVDPLAILELATRLEDRYAVNLTVESVDNVTMRIAAALVMSKIAK